MSLVRETCEGIFHLEIVCEFDKKRIEHQTSCRRPVMKTSEAETKRKNHDSVRFDSAQFDFSMKQNYSLFKLSLQCAKIRSSRERTVL